MSKVATEVPAQEIEGLTEKQNIAYLFLASQNQKCVIHDIYDVGSDGVAIASALAELIPDFEYPDHSHKTIGDIVRCTKARTAPWS